MTQDTLKSERTRLRREHQRGHYDRESLYALLDAVPLAHLGYVHDGQPFVTPTLQWREGDRVYWHGSSASRALRQSSEASVCLTVTRVDGMVLARSAFHHSMNYASAMILGQAQRVAEPDKERHLEGLMETLVPGRWPHLRSMTAQEVKATTILWMALEEASVKCRSGPPSDDDADYALPIWAGVAPVHWHTSQLVPDPRNQEGLNLPDHLKDYRFQRVIPSQEEDDTGHE